MSSAPTSVQNMFSQQHFSIKLGQIQIAWGHSKDLQISVWKSVPSSILLRRQLHLSCFHLTYCTWGWAFEGDCPITLSKNKSLRSLFAALGSAAVFTLKAFHPFHPGPSGHVSLCAHSSSAMQRKQSLGGRREHFVPEQQVGCARTAWYLLPVISNAPLGLPRSTLPSCLWTTIKEFFSLCPTEALEDKNTFPIAFCCLQTFSKHSVGSFTFALGDTS